MIIMGRVTAKPKYLVSNQLDNGSRKNFQTD